MKKSRYTESQIIEVLKEVNAGMKVEEVCRQHGISSATYTIGSPSTAAWKRLTSND